MQKIIKTLACGAVATLAAIGLSRPVQAQAPATSTSSTNAWLGTPVYQTGPAPTTGSGGTTQDNDSWGGNANGTAGAGALAQAFEVTTSGILSTAELVMSGSPASFNVELYSLGPASSFSNYPAAPGNPPAITQLNQVGGTNSPNLLTSSAQVSFAGVATGQTLWTLTFGGAGDTANGDVQLVVGNIYLLSLDPTANADGTWWVRGAVPVAAYNTGEGFNADGVEGLQCFEGKSSVRDFDLAITEGTAVVTSNATVLGTFQGSNDPTDAGWVNPANGDPITAPTNAASDSFVAAGVPGYAQSLQITGTAGSFGSDSLELEFSAAQIAAFNTNSWITFTFSVPSAATAGVTGGYSQIYNLVLNAPGYGDNNQSWANAEETGNTGGNTAGSYPNFYFSANSPLQTQVVTYNYSSVLAAIKAGGESYLQMTFQGNQGGGAPDYIYLNNVVLSTGPFGTVASGPPPPPPTVGIATATPALRMFAGSSSVSARQELATQDQNQSWIGGSYPVKYSFTIIGDNAETNYFQTHIFLVPINTIPGGAAGSGPGTGAYNNGYAEYQASNNLWLQIYGTNGSPAVSANISWKTNNPNSNPTNVVALSITNSTIIGTWTLAFSSASQGSLTAPGAAPAAFTITDPNVSTDFANPLVAYVGVQANTTGAIGGYHDYSQISITGVAGNSEVDNFLADTTINTSLWAINPTSASSSIILVTASDPLWVTWTLPATGYGLGVTPTLPVTAQPGNTGGFVLPAQYNGYYDSPITNIEGGTKMWALIPSDCLPSNVNPAQTNAFFEVVNPPPAN